MKIHFEKLYKFLGYEFKSRELLEQALRHRSVSKLHNERLEFLGDAVVNFIVAEALYCQWPHAQEGELSRLRSAIVCTRNLAELAQSLYIKEFLHLGQGEIKTGGRDRASILADAMEAVIAAIYLDGGFEICKALVVLWFKKQLEEPQALGQLKDAKSRLQEFMQAAHLPLPTYNIKSTKGEPHDQVFTITCYVEGLKIITEATASNRRQAEQKAAELFLKSWAKEPE